MILHDRSTRCAEQYGSLLTSNASVLASEIYAERLSLASIVRIASCIMRHYFLGEAMKLILQVLASLALSASFIQAHACGTSGAKVTQVFQWDDGNIFVVLSQGTDCACSIRDRVAFHKDANEKFLMATALTALTTGKTVFIRAVENNCAIHGNTARLVGMGILQ